MFGEPFAMVMMCKDCKVKTTHLIELDSIHFKEKLILFWSTCSVCQDCAFEAGEKATSYLNKCDYEWWDSAEPLEDKVCKN